MSALVSEGSESEDDGLRGFFIRHGGSDSDSEAGGGEDECADAQKEEQQLVQSAATATTDAVTEAEESTYESPLLSTPIRLHQKVLSGIGFQLWPAATFLCRELEALAVTSGALERLFGAPPAEARVLELGTGVGLCGIFAAQALGCRRVVLSDLEEVLPATRASIGLNTPGLADRCVACALPWGESVAPALAAAGGGVDVVLAADVVYWQHLHAPLLQTLRALCAHGAVALVAHTKRWGKDERFFAACRKALAVEVVRETVERCAEGRRVVTRLYRIAALPPKTPPNKGAGAPGDQG